MLLDGRPTGGRGGEPFVGKRTLSIEFFLSGIVGSDLEVGTLVGGEGGDKIASDSLS